MAANAAGKPVVVLKVGSSEASAKAAQAHTGSLVGNDRVFDALCRRLGLSRVRSLEELNVTAHLFARIGAIHGSGVAFVALSGGMCEILTDPADVARTADEPRVGKAGVRTCRFWVAA